MNRETVHTFAGSIIDRANVARDDEELAGFLASPEALFLPFRELKPLTKSQPELGFLGSQDVRLSALSVRPVFLGLVATTPHFAIDLSRSSDPKGVVNIPSDWSFRDSLGVAQMLPAWQTSILAQARSLISWHASHQFCAVCGQQTSAVRGGRLRICKDCGAEHFPRTDPVAIMLIHQDDHCLLGQPHGPLVSMGIWSALAGFIEQGESIEEAVRREIREESGIEVGRVKYHSSQPWPFPSSLMIGCLGEGLSWDIQVDPEEMHAVRWFERDEVRRALQGESHTLRLPGPIAIAHFLVREWALNSV